MLPPLAGPLTSGSLIPERPMQHLEVPQLLGLLALMLGAAKLLGWLTQRIGQPAVLGELLAGVVLGTSVLGLVQPKGEVLHFLAEVGVVILLLEIGLETDLRKLLAVGGSAAVVAAVGVAPPLLKALLPPQPGRVRPEPEGIEELVTEA